MAHRVNLKNNKARVALFKRIELRTQVAALYRQNLTQAEIGKQLGIAQSTVGRILAAVDVEWREERVADIEAYKQQELQALAHIEREAWEQWHRSKAAMVDESSTRTVESGRTDRKGNKLPDRVREGARRRELHRLAEARYLEVIANCRAQRQRILGVYAADKAPVGPDGKPVQGGFGVLIASPVIDKVEWENAAREHDTDLEKNALGK